MGGLEMKKRFNVFRLVMLVIVCCLVVMPLTLVNAAAGLITDLKVNDTARANYWVIKSGL